MTKLSFSGLYKSGTKMEEMRTFNNSCMVKLFQFGVNSLVSYNVLLQKISIKPSYRRFFDVAPGISHFI